MYRSPLSLLSGVYVTRYRDASEEMKQVEMSEMELEAAFFFPFFFKVRFKIPLHSSTSQLSSPLTHAADINGKCSKAEEAGSCRHISRC